MDKLIPIGADKIFALVGISKNSGKTSVLNAILQAFPQYRWAVLSTGIDGEELDALFQTPKPQVALAKGSLFVCDEESLRGGSSGIRLLQRFEDVGRILYIARAERDLKVRITGPASVKSQRNIIRILQKEGADKVLVDGALDRKSIALDEGIDALILCVGASFGNTESIKEEIRRLIIMRDIPLFEGSCYLKRRFAASDELLRQLGGRWFKSGIKSILGDGDALQELFAEELESLYLPTALTDAVFENHQSQLRHLKSLVIRHPQNLQLSLANLNKLMRITHVQSLIPFKIKAFAINSTAIGATQPAADEYRREIRDSFPELRFIDIMEV